MSEKKTKHGTPAPEASGLRDLRNKLQLTQHEMARALDVSFATLNRWERGHRQVPSDVAKLLDSLRRLVEQASLQKGRLTVEEICEAVRAAGVSGVVSNAAVSGMLPKSLILGLAAIPRLAWLAGAAGIGVLGVLAFFQKSSTKSRAGRSDSKGKSK